MENSRTHARRTDQLLTWVWFVRSYAVYAQAVELIGELPIQAPLNGCSMA